MAIRFFSENTNFTLANRRILNRWIHTVILSHKKNKGDINVIFTSNSYILEINQKYLQHNYFTDIITFNFNQDDFISGDIYISVDTVKENSLKYSNSFLDELHRVIIHGIMHLLGYNDQTNQEIAQMRKAEDDSLALLKKS